jgi:ubiquinone/menaquinone biosynthesis C-methylase UbiE
MGRDYGEGGDGNEIFSHDKNIERQRYDARSLSLLTKGASPGFDSNHVARAISPIYLAPYLYYEQCILRYVSPDHHALELGCGTGLHTYSLIQAGARVVAVDISVHSLRLLLQRIDIGRTDAVVDAVVADMESLPFEADSFDVVTAAGSLSYGESDRVDAEIRRVLRPGGIFICVDSLNHNPVYRLNRFIHYLKGRRTKSTLLRMPTMARIQAIARTFKDVEVRYFGAVSFLMPLLALAIGQKRAARFSDACDSLVRVRRSAFKFVLVAHGRL